MPWEQLLYGITILVLATPLGLGIRAILRGDLITRKAFEDATKILTDAKDEVNRELRAQLAIKSAEAETWRLANSETTQINAKLVRQQEQLLEGNKTTIHAITALRAGEGDGHAD